MSRFLNKPTPTERAAIAALRRVLQEGGPSSVDRVYAEVASVARAKERTAALGAKMGGNTLPCAEWLRGKRLHSRLLNIHAHPLHLDHTSFYRHRDGSRAIVTEPYWLRLREMRDLAAYADQHGLDVTVSASQSAWFPGMTLAVEITPERP